MDGEAGWWTTSGNIGLPPLARAMGVGRQHNSTKRIQLARGWFATVNRDCAKCIHLILPLRRPGPPVFLGKPVMGPRCMAGRAQLLAGDIESNPGPKPTLKPFYTHSLNTRIHQSNPLNPPHPHSPQHTHPHLFNPLCLLGKTHPHTKEHLFNCTHLYTSNNILDLWMSPGMVVPLLARSKGRLPGLP